ncbi:molybdate ABC transporter permease subunit [Candidatus Poribacteria bacterium]|nr:molybdate ABC transporter permease subunit [Candidatus Poribacteria bacterium]
MTARRRQIGSSTLLWLGSSGLILFLLVPIAVLLLAVRPDVLSRLASEMALRALWLSLKTTAIASATCIVLGLPVAHLLARVPFRGKAWLDTFLDLPVAIPPVVAGVALLLVFGRHGLIGRYLDVAGIRIGFTTLAVVMSQVFVASPLFVRSACAGFEAVDVRLEQAASTLGATPWRTFRTVSLPIALPALLAGVVSAWARALSEFGATMMFAGNIPGRTQTLTMAVMSAMESDLETALAVSSLTVVLAVGSLLGTRALLRSWQNRELCPAREEDDVTGWRATHEAASGDLTASFRVSAGDIELSMDVSVRVGEIVAIVGPSGAGKTTALSVLSGLLMPEHGRIALGGTVLFDSDRGVWVPTHLRRMGVVFQEYALLPNRTVRGNVAYGMRPGGKRSAMEWIERLGLSGLEDRRATDLSGGQRQRVAIARALASEPKALLLDEPFSALDPTTATNVRAELREFLHVVGLPTIVVVHDPLDALVLADRILVLDQGKIIQSGSKEDLLAHPRSPFVAELIGVNFYECELAPGSGLKEARAGTVTFHVLAAELSGRAHLAFAPSEVALMMDVPTMSIQNVFNATVVECLALVDRVRVGIDVGVPMVAEVTREAADNLHLEPGAQLWAMIKATAIRVYP